MVYTFGQLLKNIRLENNDSQADLATKLNLSSEELSSVDTVTISRWERGVTTPTPSKCLRILRCLETDLYDFIISLPSDATLDNFNVSMRKKFQSLSARITSANYDYVPYFNQFLIIEKPLISTRQDPMIDKLRNYHYKISYLKDALKSVDLESSYKAEKAIGCKYVDMFSNNILGHNIAFTFEKNTIEKLFLEQGYNIDLNKASAYTKQKTYAYFSFNKFSLNEKVLRRQIVSEFNYLARRSNIYSYYVSVAVDSTVKFLESLNFKITAYEEPSDLGIVKVGSKKYSRVIMSIDTSDLLANKEVIKILTLCDSCSNPCYKR
ncbi:hypothetical protein VIOR3934_17963 [Vibrio orientalis CIP 102891 = ATCC 33934]|uniref:HTH cro/C1-type domain-containing protein n=1 Tax=Vibrio orientalis CIP 102891 = ATCC 33934 TaxID=675816 RepID=C9QL28_VIBOR|nr:helix-turn-helix transcriptional regulator [Vibrio orientalis]EEX91508.1 hypothetical protein VIA_002150 [Vibrio orientalis CIP 102891 = ATCC 33934]EGU47393.1 hypothetical protein VIOR3934_17963 [Vibrio orientalis CIP 102891 = ATCC 33934]